MHQKGNWTPSIIPRGDNHNICCAGRPRAEWPGDQRVRPCDPADRCGLRVGMKTKERPAALDRHSYSYKCEPSSGENFQGCPEPPAEP